MEITSSAFMQETMIPKKYTCQGENSSPPLFFSNVPENTKSLALEVRDPDAPSGDFVHWIAWNIDPTVTQIMEGRVPRGVIQGMNDFGKPGWGGPCPPSGIHRYEFHLYALDQLIQLPQVSTKIDLRSNMNGSILEEASIVGLYTKSSRM